MAEFRAFLAWVTGKESMGEAAERRWMDVPVQRCLVHVLRNTRVDLTNRPKSEAGRALLKLARRLTKISTVDGAAN